MGRMDQKWSEANKAREIRIVGRVQGVGFRPFVFRIAHETRILGTVQNNMDGVFIHGEGDEIALDKFLYKLQNELPPLARITGINIEKAVYSGFTTFDIIPSENKGSSSLIIPVDAATCSTCEEEMATSHDKRYRYPFINCTNCGPRYTIIESLPYDRPVTTMKNFKMCSYCEGEYSDPINRRHHAQPIACPTCGPRLSYKESGSSSNLTGEAALQRTIQDIKAGKIVAIKGIGGYHLACDAENETVVQKLRDRKKRPMKPFAVMARDIAAVKKIAKCNKKEAKLLLSPEAPIVLLTVHDWSRLAPSVFPSLNTVGIFLPYTPLHHLLMEEFKFLIMTSGNLSGEPMMYEDEVLDRRGSFLVDSILSHNRPILRPIDDSVVEMREGNSHFYRRARGYVPDPIDVSVNVDGIISLGAQLKNTFTFGREKQLFVGPHNGDLENIVSINQSKKTMNEFLQLTGIEPKLWVVDKHPNYPHKGWIGESTIPIYEVWHHHAHMVSCMADNDLPLEETCIGVILDGTGYGTDGKIWGFEWLVGNVYDFTRATHVKYQPLPGGEAAIRDTWRQAAAWLIDTMGDKGMDIANELFKGKKEELQWINLMLQQNLQITWAGTCGRLFDLVSALLNCCTTSTYEGEGAIRLSELVRGKSPRRSYYSYDFETTDDTRVFNTDEMLREVTYDILQGKDKCRIGLKFHETLVKAIVEECLYLVKKHDTKKIVFSGGSMHNSFLEEGLRKGLESHGLKPYFHRSLPCNDGGLSFGQGLIAAYKFQRKEGEKKCVSGYQEKL
ncbi:MAG: carbamoyltransferase HypF [Bacillus sp. (in: Bacteria)]|nr:carbamoyltransferase HypF [Bacillus sp. (in: firmicutes)]